MSEAAQTLPTPARRWSPTAALVRRYPPLVVVAMGFLVAMVLIAVFAAYLSPYDYAQQSLLRRLKPPVWLGGLPEYVLGTDQLGRDILSRLLHGIRLSLFIAFAGTALGAVFGTTLGFLAAHRRGVVEEIIVMLVDLQAAMPYLIVALAVLAFLGNSFLLFIVIVGLYGWEKYARLTRSLVLGTKDRGYALAVRSLGASPLRIYLRHLLPNIASVLIVRATINFPETVLLETSLSFLGLGVQPPQTSLGLMLGSGRQYLTTAWWIAVLPGMAIFLTTLSMSIVGDWVRDRLDPTLHPAE